jgi:predicted ATPase
LGIDGAHLPSALYHLAARSSDSAALYASIANRLSELIDDVQRVWVDKDDKRDVLTLQVTSTEGTSHAARALSDGTLRFLALAVFEKDFSQQGLLCLEEPENGIHPERIPAMLRLLQDIATDLDFPVSEADNPLRQVIINTHSPVVVNAVPDDSLLVVRLQEDMRDAQRFRKAVFMPLPDTWRAAPGVSVIPKGDLLAYLNPATPIMDDVVPRDEAAGPQGPRRSPRRLVDRDDMTPYLPHFAEAK